jgi:hypothetical protein
MKKFFSFLLGSIFLTMSSVHGAENTLAMAFKSAIENFEYARSVEWDQKDQDELKRIYGELEANMAQLSSQGFGKKDLIDYLSKEAKISEIQKLLIVQKIEMLDFSTLTQAQLIDVYQSIIGATSHHGASWAGSIDLEVVAEVAAYVVGGFALIWVSMSIRCVEYSTTQITCRRGVYDSYNCSPRCLETRWDPWLF